MKTILIQMNFILLNCKKQNKIIYISLAFIKLNKIILQNKTQMASEFSEVLNNYFPASSVKTIAKYIKKSNILLKITRTRKYKLGDYRPPSQKTPSHRISINGNLNHYYTLLVFLHELGHLHVWNKHKSKVKPHGKQWKDAYEELIMEFIDENVFPSNLKEILQKSTKNLKATFSSDPKLFRILASYDQTISKKVFLEEIPSETRFVAANGKTFIKQNKKRRRFRCLCLNNKRYYLIHPFAKIEPLNTKTDEINSV